MRTAIHVRCDNQVLSYVEMPFIASGDVNEDKIEFEFDPMWEGFTKTAVFYRTEADVFHVLLEEDDTCIIPHEVLAEPGPLYFGVFGTRGDRVRTSEIIQYTIKQGAITEATKISDPTPDIYSQILTACEEATRIANEALNKSGTGGGLTEEQASDLAANTEARHKHNNPDVLKKLGEADGKLTFDGKAIDEDKEVESLPADKITYENENLVDQSGTVKGALDEIAMYAATMLPGLEENKHSHSNKSVLDKIREKDGSLTYNGKPVGGTTERKTETITFDQENFDFMFVSERPFTPVNTWWLSYVGETPSIVCDSGATINIDGIEIADVEVACPEIANGEYVSTKNMFQYGEDPYISLVSKAYNDPSRGYILAVYAFFGGLNDIALAVDNFEWSSIRITFYVD